MTVFLDVIESAFTFCSSIRGHVIQICLGHDVHVENECDNIAVADLVYDKFTFEAGIIHEAIRYVSTYVPFRITQRSIFLFGAVDWSCGEALARGNSPDSIFKSTRAIMFERI